MTTATLLPAQWTDSKRYLWLLGIPMTLLPLVGGLLVNLTGNALFWWTPIAFVYGLIPFLDWLIGADASNPPDEAVPTLEKDRYYRWAVYLAVPLQYVSFIYGVWVIATHDLAWYSWLGLAMSVGMVGGIGINTAHELGHKTDSFERWLAKISLAQTAYGQFFVEHPRGHHVRVATPEDPATSRFGESFWEFYPRVVIGSHISAWRLERERLTRHRKSVWHWSNHNLQAWAITVVLYGALTALFGWKVLPFILLQAFYGSSLLEAVNYVEHYGLCRQRMKNGHYERCHPKHSWNSNHTVTNLMLYQLQRHSDHHANPTRPYQALRHFDESPQLPSGYASMVLLAYMTPIWFAVMNPRVVAHYGGDMTKANIKPSLRRKVIAQYPALTA
ncbi:alkane 1-monooxygenase [Stenotrophobium rhamnosiphilum]|uniref:Alkane 1-monooxygenase n=1 Tax=Stenotrophobium rhamnosiphilum TaxID=2029166 RepID=A0A2T5MFF8_9GAMM|nr:alkane 1-monooxygenase [Stenotrophobium rhamnosiphilum]PTU31323.1 alkane 1-monooxygenase [Stenotrophobium rhamnosiphilum]